MSECVWEENERLKAEVERLHDLGLSMAEGERQIIMRLERERDEARTRVAVLTAERDEVLAALDRTQQAARAELEAILDVLDNAPTPHLNNDRTPSTLAERVEWLVWAWREAHDSHAALLSQTRWMPVDRRRPAGWPTECNFVLISTVRGIVEEAKVKAGGKFQCIHTERDITEHVTHWMPLPAPPLPELLTSVADRADEMARRLFGDDDGGEG